MLVQVVLRNRFTQIAQDLIRRGNWHAGPGFPLETKGKKVAVGTNAREFVGVPGAAKGLLPLQNGKPLVGMAPLQVIGGIYAGNARAHDQHIDLQHFGLGQHGRVRQFIHLATP